MEIGSLERRVAKTESGNTSIQESIQEILAGNKVTELRNVGSLAYSVKYKWERQLKIREHTLKRD